MEVSFTFEHDFYIKNPWVLEAQGFLASIIFHVPFFKNHITPSSRIYSWSLDNTELRLHNMPATRQYDCLIGTIPS